MPPFWFGLFFLERKRSSFASKLDEVIPLFAFYSPYYYYFYYSYVFDRVKLFISD